MSEITKWILQMVDAISKPAKDATKAVRGTEDAIDDTARAADEMAKRGRDAQGKFMAGQKKVTDAIDETNSHMRNGSAIDIYAMGQSVQQLSDDITRFTQPGADFQANLLEVSAITGVVGDQLDFMGDAARKSAKEFGGNAAAQLDSYKTLLSRLGPEIASVPEAVGSMGDHISTLSKTMNGDVAGATDALTTSMLQYQVSLEDPIAASAEMERMMNVMAAGAKYGAAEVPQIGAALEQTGVQAKLANLTFEESNAALQALADGGKYGSEAGVGMRNFLTQISATGTLSKDAKRYMAAYGVDLKKVSDTTVPFADRLKMLAPLQNDLNALTEIFGRENAANAQILIRSGEEQRALTTQITGTSVATEQAAVVMGSYNERMKRWGAFIADIGIDVFSATESILPFVQGGADAITMLANLKNAQQGLGMITKWLTGITWIQTIANNAATAAQWALNAAFYASPMGWIVVAIGLVVAAVVWAWNTFEGFRGVLYGVWEATKTVFGGMGDFIGEVLSGVWGLLQGVFNPVNWFNDDYSFSAELSKITDAAHKYGEAVGKSFEEGKAKGVASFRADNAQTESGGSIDRIAGNASPAVAGAGSSVVVPAGGGKGGKQLEISGGSGGGGSKTTTMTLNVHNHFHGINSSMDVERIADKITRKINDRIKDTLAVG